MRAALLLLGFAWCTLGGKSHSRRQASRTLAVKEAIRAGLIIDARLRLTAGAGGASALVPSEIRDSVRAEEDALVECLLVQTRALGPLGGNLEFRVEISGDGSAASATLMSDAPSALRACLEATLLAVSYPSSPSATASRATVRLSLDPSLVGPAIESALFDAAAEKNRENSFMVKLAWPVANTKVNSKFGRRPDPLGNTYQFHTGVDLRAKMGQPITASAAGKVVYAGWRTMRGKEVVLEHPSGLRTGYGHLSQIKVSQGQWVSEGQTVGLAGSTGKSTWPHLHFEVSMGKKKLDPLKLLGKAVDIRTLKSHTVRGKTKH